MKIYDKKNFHYHQQEKWFSKLYTINYLKINIPSSIHHYIEEISSTIQVFIIIIIYISTSCLQQLSECSLHWGKGNEL